jgi:N-acetylglutamate synthase-like GNAT family acetyltransferase
MAVSELSSTLTRVELTLADVPAGLALSDAAGWNQTADDWAVFIEHGHTVGLRTSDGRIVATAAALPYEGEFGWVAMVLVATAFRHQGFATRLMDECVRTLQQCNVTPVLDATPAGAQVYRRIGFVAGFELERWDRGLADAEDLAATSADLRRAGADDLDAIVRLDAAANRVGRRFLLEAFLRRPDTRAWIAREASGFVIARRGRRATQVGPLVAESPAQAMTLLAAVLADVAGPVFLDVPTRWTQMAAWLEQRGFKRQRGFVRMALGAADVLACSERLFVLAGPEFG